MSRNNSLNYNNVDYENFSNKIKYSDFKKAFDKTIIQNRSSSVILLEIPAERYIETNIWSVKSMINNGFEGIYLSFQRPYNNLSSMLKNNGINLNKLFIIDCATSFSGEKTDKNLRETGISQNFEVEDIINAIHVNLSKLNIENKFVFIDSLTTLALYESFFDTSRFTELLIKSIKKNELERIALVFNIAKDLPQKKLVEDFMVDTDNYIHLGFCT